VFPGDDPVYYIRHRRHQKQQRGNNLGPVAGGSVDIYENHNNGHKQHPENRKPVRQIHFFIHV
jgi:hypothetical protein